MTTEAISTPCSILVLVVLYVKWILDTDVGSLENKA
jgi:hypothetical protein